ncbi:ABC transporter permease [Natronosalvus caseinilyticus]|uniref:ABC transporter permease n=1 Tax=Natronosalvus caseinilyticus TaxID=2953747 RepID=UPI0028A9C51B|nr:ABC transporter permease subunit [Natronosalvus caseinilyticus]
MSSEAETGLLGRLKATIPSISSGFHWHVLTRIKQIVLPLVVISVVWHVGALLINDPAQLPSPVATVMQTYEILTTPDFRELTVFDHLQLTLRRALLSSTVAIVLAVVGGVLMSTNAVVEDAVSSWLPFWMTTPTVVIILLAMVWFNFSETAVYFAVIVASTPFGTVNMWEGAKDVDVKLLTMANAYDASTASVWRHIYLPHLLPYLFGSYRYILGMVWKIVVLAEVFGLSVGIGAMFRYYFQQGELIMVLAYLIPFIVVVLTIEYGVLKPLETRLFRWRG